MAIKVRLPNGRYIKVNTDDPAYAKQKGIEYYKNGNEGFVDNTTLTMANTFDEEMFDYETGVSAPWLRAKLAAMESLSGKENILTEAVGSEGFTRNSKGDLALTKTGLERLGIEPTSNKNVIIDESGFGVNDLADFAGLIGPIAGSIAGSIITRGKIKPKFKNLRTKTIGDIGKISVGTGIGAASGKGIEEGIEYTAGLQDNSAGELASLLATEAAIGAGGEAIFGLGGKLLKYSFGQKALTRGELGRQDLLNANFYAKGIIDSKTGDIYKGAVAIGALDSPITGVMQGIAETVSKSKTRTEGLKKALVTDLSNLVRSTNNLTENFSKSIDDVISTGYKDASADFVAGEGIKKGLMGSFSNSTKQLDVANSNLEKSMNGILRDFDAFELPATTEAGESIRTATAESYAQWADTSRDLYSQVNKFFKVPGTAIEGVPAEFLEEGIPFIDVGSLTNYARVVKRGVIGPGKPLEGQKQLASELDSIITLGENSGNKVSLEKLIELRSELGSQIRIGAEGQAKFAQLDSLYRTRLYEVINTTIDNLTNAEDVTILSIQEALEKVGRKGISGIQGKNKIKASLQSIKIANSFYAKGLQSFDQGKLKSIFNDATAGGWDTDKILTNILLKKDNGETLKRYLNTLNVETAGFSRIGKEGSKIVDRSKAPLEVPLTFNDKQTNILKKAGFKVTNPTFNNKNEVKEVLQKEFIRSIVKLVKDKGKMNYRTIANKIDSYGTTGDALFGSSQRNELTRALREFDDLSKITTIDEFNKIINTSDNVDDIILSIRNKVLSQLQIEDVNKIDVFKKIQNGTIDTEGIVSSLFKKGNTDEIIKVKEMLGPESVEFKQFQVSAMQKMLSDFVHPGEDAISKLFNENKFYDVIFSPTGYGESVLKETFGETQYKNLKNIATRFKFAAGGEGSTAGNLMTTNLVFKMAMAPIQALGQFTPLRAVAWGLGNSRIISLLVGETPPSIFIKNDLPTLLNQYGVVRTGLVAPASVAARQFPIREAIDSENELIQQFENKGADPKAPISSVLDLPDIMPTNPNQQPQGMQGGSLLPPLPRGLLGGNTNTEDIAQSLGRLA